MEHVGKIHKKQGILCVRPKNTPQNINNKKNYSYEQVDY